MNGNENIRCYTYKNAEDSFEWIGFDIVYEQETVGYIFLFTKDCEHISEDAFWLLNYVGTLCNIEVRAKKKTMIVKRKYKSVFFKKLFLKNISIAEIEKEAHDLQWTLPQNARVILIQGINDLTVIENAVAIVFKKMF